MNPRARIGPAAHVIAHIGASSTQDGLPDGAVTLLLVELKLVLVVDGVATAEVNLDEVEA